MGNLVRRILWTPAVLAAIALVVACSAAPAAVPEVTVTETKRVTATETVTVLSTESVTVAPAASLDLPPMFSCVEAKSGRLFQVVRSGGSFTGTSTTVDLVGEGVDAELLTTSLDVRGSVLGDSFTITTEGGMSGLGTVSAGHVILNETSLRGDVIASYCDETNPSSWNQLIRNFSDAVDFEHAKGAGGG